MNVLNVDPRNMVLMMDNLQAKLLVEILRRTPLEIAIQASEEVQKDGFGMVFADDAMAAISSYCSIVGYRTDMMVGVLPAQEQSIPVVQESGDTKPTVN